MEALFIVPVLVSDNVNERIVPALSKIIERNIVLTNGAIFRAAALKKYSGIFATVKKEGEEVIDKEILTEKEKIIDPEVGKVLGSAWKGLTGRATTTRTAEKGEYAHSTTDVEKIELPSGIQFFSTISLEPTYLQIPIKMKSGIFSPVAERTIVIGVKAVPYKAKGVSDIVAMMKNMASLGLIQRFFFRYWNTIQNKILVLSDRWWSYKGKKSGEATDIIFSPSSQQLSSSSYLSGLMSAKKGTSWSTVACLSTFDFEESDLKQSLTDYRWLVQAGWGDIMIVNEPKESVHFCTAKMNACYELPFAYMKQVLNLSNILDYSEIQRWNKPFHVTGVGRALSDGTTHVPDDVTGRLLEIING